MPVSIAFATIAGPSADIDQGAIVETAPQRSGHDAHELADQFDHSMHVELGEPDAELRLAEAITDRIGANWGRVPAVVIGRNAAGEHFAFLGDIIGVDAMTVQFANDRRLPMGRVVAVGMS